MLVSTERVPEEFVFTKPAVARLASLVIQAVGAVRSVVVALLNCCSALHVFAWARFNPTVCAVEPLYEPLKVRVPLVAVSAPKVPPSATPEMVELDREEFGIAAVLSVLPLQESPVPAVTRVLGVL